MGSFNWPSEGSGSSSGVPTYNNLASFPSASGEGSGALGVALDSGNLYESTGSAWILIGSNNTWLPLSGGTLSGSVTANGGITMGANIAMGGYKLTGLGSPSANGQALIYDQLGAISGVATLDSSGKVPVSQLPSVVMEYQGSWNPSTNSPTLADGTGANGNVYYVSAAHPGTISGLTDPSMTNFQIGDLVIYNSSKWQLVTPAAGVQSVNGSQGAVTVNAISQLTGDVTAGPASGSASASSSLVATSNSTLATLSGLTSAPSLATVGTIGMGTWQGTAVGVGYGGTGAGDAPTARSNLGAAKSGSNSDITSLSGLTTALSVAQGGTGQTSTSAAFNALSPLTTLGDTLFGGASGAGTRLAGNTSATKKFLTQTGTGSVSAAPSWGTIAAGDLPIAVPGTSAGAISASGVPGNTTGSAISSGYVGQVISSVNASGTSLTSGSNLDLASISVTDGVWLITGGFFSNLSSTTTHSFVGIRNGGTANTMPTGVNGAPDSNGNVRWEGIPGSGSGFGLQSAVPPYPVVFSSTQTLYLVAQMVFSGTCTATWSLYAVRIA